MTLTIKSFFKFAPRAEGGLRAEFFRLLAASALLAAGCVSFARAEPLGHGASDPLFLEAGQSAYIEEIFVGGGPVTVRAAGLGHLGCDTDIEIYDEYGDLVAAAASVSDDEAVVFTPTGTGLFTIRVINSGVEANRVVINKG